MIGAREGGAAEIRMMVEEPTAVPLGKLSAFREGAVNVEALIKFCSTVAGLELVTIRAGRNRRGKGNLPPIRDLQSRAS